MMLRLVTDLPDPDSPTTASVCPLRREKLTPSTDLTARSPWMKCVCRSSTASSRSASGAVRCFAFLAAS
jgi:hypothetical protein